MTEPHDPARAAIHLLASAPLTAVVPSGAARARAIEVAAKAIGQRRAHRRRRTYFGVLAAAAAAALLVAGGLSLRPRAPQHAAKAAAHVGVRAVVGDVRVRHEGAESPLSSASRVVPGDHVLASADGRADLALPSGTQIGLESKGDLEVVSIDARQVFAVIAGNAHFEVAKLGAEEQFVVRTSDAEIEVRGTAFEVGVVPDGWSCPNGAATQVKVREGVVVVRHAGVESRLVAGDAWPTGCAKTATAAVPPSPVPTLAQNLNPLPGAGTANANANANAIKTTSATKTTEAQSSLEAQNDMLAEALAAKRAGNRAGALSIYEKFLAKYPGSGLAEVAAVERMRLLSGPSAVAAADAYLARYPSGFARDEAKRILTGAQ